MADKKKAELTFEEALKSLEEIVSNLESGEVPLEQALQQFQRGMELSRFCQDTLNKAEETLTKVMTEDGTLANFEAGGKVDET